MKTYLISGGCGFIGSHFIRYILNETSDIHILNIDALTYAGNPLNLIDVEQHYSERYSFIKGDINDKIMIEKIFSERDIECVVHFAAESHVDRSFDDPQLFMKTNVLGTSTLLSAAMDSWQQKIAGSQKFLHISTDEVYGSLSLDCKEKFTEKSPLQPRSPYAASKASADLLAQSYHICFKFPVIITRCSNNFGSYQYPEKLIPLMIFNMKNGLPLPIYGDGNQMRNWISISDHCKALWAVLNKGQVGDIYNISGEYECSNLTLVNMLCEIVASKFGKNKDYFKKYITFIKDRPGHDLSYTMACSKVKNQTGWSPSNTFTQDLTATVEWYLTHERWIESCKKSLEIWLKSHYDL